MVRPSNASAFVERSEPEPVKFAAWLPALPALVKIAFGIAVMAESLQFAAPVVVPVYQA